MHDLLWEMLKQLPAALVISLPSVMAWIRSTQARTQSSETHKIVNSQRDVMVQTIENRDLRIDALEEMVRTLRTEILGLKQHLGGFNG